MSRHFGGLIFMGNGRVSERACKRLRDRLAAGISILGGLQQGGEPRPGCDDAELHDIVRDVAAALCGRNVQLAPSAAYQRLIWVAREASNIGGEARAAAVIDNLKQAVEAAEEDYESFTLTYPPEGCHPCNACGGAFPDEGEPECEVCEGKGFWDAADIRWYHAKYPKLCKLCCGDEHRDPPPPNIAWDTTIEKLEKLEKQVKEAGDKAKKLLSGYLCFKCGGNRVVSDRPEDFASVFVCEGCGDRIQRYEMDALRRDPEALRERKDKETGEITWEETGEICKKAGALKSCPECGAMMRPFLNPTDFTGCVLRCACGHEEPEQP